MVGAESAESTLGSGMGTLGSGMLSGTLGSGMLSLIRRFGSAGKLFKMSLIFFNTAISSSPCLFVRFSNRAAMSPIALTTMSSEVIVG